MTTWKSLCCLFFASTLLLACSKNETAQPSADTALVVMKQGDGKGLVRAVDTTGKTVTIEHNTVPGVMDAMTMQYPVADPASLRTIAVGDSVHFTLQDLGQGNYRVTNITAIKK